MNVFSLFSGIGGLELGLERAGMTTVGQVELDPYCRRVLAKHWPEVPRHDDVRTAIDWWRSEPRPRVDLVCGGFPCQPVSVAGRQLAQEDPRWLWPALAEVIRDLRPRYALMENVPGLLARGLGDVLGDLAELGYDAEWDRVPAAFVGAPHIRGRVFIVAYPNSDEHQGRTPEVAWPSTTLVPSDATKRADFGGIAQPSERALAGSRRAGVDPLADTDGIGWDGRSGVFRSRWWGQPPHSDQWATEPDVGRVAHGVPARVDRLRALGNAVVPQVAEHVGRMIMAHSEAAAA